MCGKTFIRGIKPGRPLYDDEEAYQDPLKVAFKTMHTLHALTRDFRLLNSLFYDMVDHKTAIRKNRNPEFQCRSEETNKKPSLLIGFY